MAQTIVLKHIALVANIPASTESLHYCIIKPPSLVVNEGISHFGAGSRHWPSCDGSVCLSATGDEVRFENVEYTGNAGECEEMASS